METEPQASYERKMFVIFCVSFIIMVKMACITFLDRRRKKAIGKTQIQRKTGSSKYGFT